jgi:hypothetical protein
VADLGNVDQLTRPVLIDRADAPVYVEALSNMLFQKDDKEDHDILSSNGRAYQCCPVLFAAC